MRRIYLMILLVFACQSHKGERLEDFDAVSIYDTLLSSRIELILSTQNADLARFVETYAKEDSLLESGKGSVFNYKMENGDTIEFSQGLSFRNYRVHNDLISFIHENAQKLTLVKGRFSNHSVLAEISFVRKNQIVEIRGIRSLEEYLEFINGMLVKLGPSKKGNLIINALGCLRTSELFNNDTTYLIDNLYNKYLDISMVIDGKNKSNYYCYSYDDVGISLGPYNELKELVTEMDSISKPYLSNKVEIYRLNKFGSYVLLATGCPEFASDCN